MIGSFAMAKERRQPENLIWQKGESGYVGVEFLLQHMFPEIASVWWKQIPKQDSIQRWSTHRASILLIRAFYAFPKEEFFVRLFLA